MYPKGYYLYTLPECSGCESARRILKEKQIEYVEVQIDNPSVELGTKLLFNNKVYAPYLFHPTEGVYIFNNQDLLKCSFAKK